MVKDCTTCGKEKPLDAFYKHKSGKHGRAAVCKECFAAYRKKKYYEKSLDERTSYNKEYYRENSEERLWLQKTKYKKARLERDRQRRKNDPDRYNVWTLTQRAIRKGILKKGPCEACGSIHVQAHHDDYSKPFDVHWLCRRHHIDLHMQIRRQQQCG